MPGDGPSPLRLCDERDTVTDKVDKLVKEPEAAPAEESSRADPAEGVDEYRGDTQLFGVTAPDPSPGPSSQTHPSHLSSADPGASDPSAAEPNMPRPPRAMVDFGDKQIDLDKMRDSYLGELVAGRFKIVDFIDRGGMGEVYLGLNEAVGQRVAVKFLSKRFTSDANIVTRFGNEARSYAKVTHPNAVTLLDYGQHDDGALYIITEFIEGASLSKTVKQRGPLTPAQVVSIGKQCSDVLIAAHQEGVIHRDLKPDNIMITPGPRDRFVVKVLDFGIAKITDDEMAMTETGAIFGTPEFMSPEQARGDGAEPRSDLYALGAILYYALTGKLPFRGKNKFAVLNKHLNDPPTPPAQIAPHLDIPGPLEAVIMKCLNKGPEERYANAEDLYDALDEVRDSLALGQTDPDRPPRPDTAASSSEIAQAPTSDPGELVDEPPYELGEDFQFDSEHPGAESPDPKGVSSDTLQESSIPPVQLGTLASSPGVEPLGDEIEDLDAGVDEDDLWDEDDLRVGMSTPARLVLVLLAIGVVALAATMGPQLLEGGGGEADTGRGEAPGVEQPQAARAELERALVVGQVQGLLASAEFSLELGEPASARAHLERSRTWAPDDQLTPRVKRQRADLQERVERLGRLESKAARLRDARDCQGLRKLLPEVRELSRGAGERWLKAADACASTGRRKETAPAASRRPDEREGDRASDSPAHAQGAPGGGEDDPGSSSPPPGADAQGSPAVEDPRPGAQAGGPTGEETPGAEDAPDAVEGGATEPGGSDPDGSEPDGSEPDGAGPDGSEPDGAGPDGPAGDGGGAGPAPPGEIEAPGDRQEEPPSGQEDGSQGDDAALPPKQL